MACRLFGAKPLPEPILTYCQLYPEEQTSVKFKSKYKAFHSWNHIWKNVVCEMASILSRGDELNNFYFRWTKRPARATTQYKSLCPPSLHGIRGLYPVCCVVQSICSRTAALWPRPGETAGLEMAGGGCVGLLVVGVYHWTHQGKILKGNMPPCFIEEERWSFWWHFSSLAAPKVIKMTSSDENFVKMIAFPF